ncbi:MAG TPA: hypothetical protein VF815_10190 [Myxococcaceae bacterium]
MRSLNCSRCGATHELTGRKPGERFPCSCGNELVTPGWSTRKKVGFALSLLGMAILVIGGMGLTLYLRGLQVAKAMDNAFRAEGGGDLPLGDEARLNVLSLCNAVEMYRAEHGELLVAGPTPPQVPQGGKPVPFPHDEAFEKLGFAPGTDVRLQYQVVVEADPVGEPEVTCYARGDQDGDGQNSVYSVKLDANGMTSTVKVEREDE